MRKLIALLMLCVCGLSLAASNPPIQSDRDGAHPHGAKAEQTMQMPVEKQRGTEEAPIFIKGLTSPESEDEAGHKQYERHEKPTLERLMGWGTLALAIFTCLLFVFTALLWYQTYRLSVDAKESGDAQDLKMQASIKEAERAATAMEKLAAAAGASAQATQDMFRRQSRAYVIVESGKATYQDERLFFEGHPVLTNTGHTPARDVSYKINAGVHPGILPDEFVFDDSAETISNDAGLGPRQNFVIAAAVRARFSDADVAEIMRGKDKRLWVWGVVKYKDIYGDEWETNFCQNYTFFWVTEDDGKKWMKVDSYYHRVHNNAT